MDTSKEYIEMCEKSEEVQEGWSPKEGDYYCYQDIMCGHPVHTVTKFNLEKYEHGEIICTLCSYSYDSFQEIMGATRANINDALTGRFIFLPKQDQLQEMLLDDWHMSGLMQMANSNYWSESDCPDEPTCSECIEKGKYFRAFKSFEQLWLAFVMEEKYNKQWNGKEWKELNHE